MTVKVIGSSSSHRIFDPDVQIGLPPILANEIERFAKRRSRDHSINPVAPPHHPKEVFFLENHVRSKT